MVQNKITLPALVKKNNTRNAIMLAETAISRPKTHMHWLLAQNVINVILLLHDQRFAQSRNK